MGFVGFFGDESNAISILISRAQCFLVLTTESR